MISTHEEIAIIAYYIWIGRQAVNTELDVKIPGSDLSDWFEAEAILKEQHVKLG